MKARGYGYGPRSSYEYFKMNQADWVAIMYLLSLLSFSIVERISGYGFLTVYPLMETWHLSLMDTAVLISYTLFLIFPLLVEAGGMFRWRLSN
jgi:energy-coupling factor transport system permease protein